jgi:integrase
LRLAPLVFIRPGEIIALEWAFVHWDSNEIRYIPNKTVKKTGVELIIPLTTQALAILEEAHKISGKGKYIFAGSNPKRHMSENTINQTLRRIGIDTQEELTGHGFRATAATLLTEVHGYNRDVVELQLAHKLKDSNGGAYHRATHIEQRRKMMQIWADYLDELRVQI